MSRFQRAVREGVDRGIKQAVESEVLNYLKSDHFAAMFERKVWEVFDQELPRNKPLTRLGFIWGLRLYFRRMGCSIAQASDLANSTLREFLRDEKIKFGHRDYAWTRSGAEEVGYEYEVHHWEARR